MLQLEKQLRHVFTRSYISHRLIAPFKAHWARHPPVGTRGPNGRNITSKNAALTADDARARLQDATGRSPDAGGPASPFPP
eukprot:4499211-Pyramimonas_sp.AAC.1